MGVFEPTAEGDRKDGHGHNQEVRYMKERKTWQIKKFEEKNCSVPDYRKLCQSYESEIYF